LRLAEEHGERDPDGSTRLPSPLTQGDLAAMIGATRQSVNKLLGDFVDERLLRMDGDTIIVCDLAALTQASRR
jgi:CRP-like cAMP-binding protein